MTDQPTVWVAQSGWYEDRSIVAVFATIEGAKRHYPADWSWTETSHDGWVNGLHYDDAVSIEEYEVIG